MCISERTDHEDECAFCSDSILVLSSHDYSEIAKDRPTSFNCLSDRELDFIYDAM